ncbi:hypothetical protein JYB87_15695 [Shewanella avicenniae]|uniref:Uncharacterized protein n=1 Tax=Shewanella avicenniae TaxID=2814294 RepID=A0ABX7QQJ1_9GAMM|nr:hypothetical protein [Shewanella avicenniae]QSX33150.1 hypothetical protein JYB87_15695 [Shewanella avicenniae]
MDGIVSLILQSLSALPTQAMKALGESMRRSRMLVVMVLLSIALMLAFGWLIFSI